MSAHHALRMFALLWSIGMLILGALLLVAVM